MSFSDFWEFNHREARLERVADKLADKIWENKTPLVLALIGWYLGKNIKVIRKDGGGKD